MKQDNETNSDAQLLEHNVRMTVGISALKRTRQLVDQVEEEERASNRFAKRFALVVFLALLALAITVIAFGPGPIVRMTRFFTGAIH
jgi:uncharacterized membrane protein